MKRYKIETYVPIEYFEGLKQALFQLNCIGKIGNYINCMSWFEVNSTWTPIDGANPFLGEVGKTEFAKEIKLEFIAQKSNLKLIVKTIKENHPYEEVGINIIALKN